MRNTIKLTLFSTAALAIFVGYILMQPHEEQDLIIKKFDFECHIEPKMSPPVSPEVDSLYRYALYLKQKNGPKDFDNIARYYRIASAHGHSRAAANLQSILSQGLTSTPEHAEEVIKLVEQFMALGAAGAYYDMGHYLEVGYGVQQDREKAYAYFRKAADLGSPDAQYYLAKLVGRLENGQKLMELLQRCAADQGHGQAAAGLAGYSRVQGKYDEAIKFYQRGVELGDLDSARRLSNAFKVEPNDEIYYMGAAKDHERSRRYAAIADFIRNNRKFNPKFPDVNKIVPLPNSELSPWDGKFEWETTRPDRNPPEKPSQQLIEKLSAAKDLDPTTGLPLEKN